MKKIVPQIEYLLLSNRQDSVEIYKRSIIGPPYINEFENYKNAPHIDNSDIKLIIKQLNDLPCCLNDFQEKIISKPKGPFQLLEIRKRNIKIKMHFSNSSENNKKNNIIFCNWCIQNCPKSEILNFKEKEINFAETNCKICSCANNKHNISRQKINLTQNEINEKNIDELINLIKNFKDNIKEEDNDKNLQIISYNLNKPEIYEFFYSLNFNDELHSKILTSLQKSKNYSSFNNIMVNYIKKYFFDQITFENPIYIYNLIFSDKKNAYALYYYNPDIFSYSFYFQIYRKKIISKNIESHECISFLRKIGINNEILSFHMINDKELMSELFSFGLFPLDSISKLKVKEYTKFKQILSYSNIILIQSNQFCEIFLDFIKNGKTECISLFDKSNDCSKFFLEKIIDSMQSLIDSRKKNDVKEIKNILINYPLFKIHFYDENRQYIIALLSSFAYSNSEPQNIFKDYGDEKIFRLIEDKIDEIVTEGKLRKKDSQQNILIVKKVLDLYKKENKNLEYLSSYDFNNLLLNIVESNYPIKLADKVLEIVRSLLYNDKLLDKYLEYLLRITLICCINFVGGSYIYNSNFIPKILEIIKKLNFNEHSHFILEMLMILKKCFNRQIIDISFLFMMNNDDEITLKEYLIDILFRNEPIISNESMYNFNIFNRLLNRVNNIYSFIFEQKNYNILLDSFADINFEDSYLNIIKSIISNMNEEFSQMHWKNENKNLNFEPQEKKEKLIDENEKQLEKKISEEVKKITKRIPGFILLDFLRCLENLNQTNFYLKYEESSYLIDDKYDLTSIIIDDKLPLAIKSLLLNFLLKMTLCLKFEPNSHKIYFPLCFTTPFEKEANESQVKDKIFITLESKESEKHLNESIKLINILIICIELLKKKEKSLNFQKAFIEKNGLYDYCVSIISALYYFSNLIINTNNIHDLYISVFLNFAKKFFDNESIFKIVMNIIDEKNNDDIFDKYEGKMLIVVETNTIIKEYINRINSDLYNFSERKLSSIYQSYKDYHNGKLTISASNHYDFLLDKNLNLNITLDELNEFNGLHSKINSPILEKYEKWIKFVNSEGIKNKDLFEKILDTKRSSSNKREYFYLFILLTISDLYSTSEYILNDHLFLKALIRIIRADEKFKTVCDDEKMKLNIKDYMKNKENDYEMIKARIIGSIIRKIYFLANYELTVSMCFSNTKQENDLSELLNSLILFLEVLGENFNVFFHDAMFKYKFDLSTEKSNEPVAKYDEESETFEMLNGEVDEKNIYSPFEVLLELHKKIFESLRITPDSNNDEKNKRRETQQNNLLIIFNSLTFCIIEFTNFKDPVYSVILNKLFLQYFNWKREDKSFNPIFQALNFEIDPDMLNKTKYIFMIHNILSLFVVYLRYGTKETHKHYFYQIHNYSYYDPNIYLFHTNAYTSQIINSLDKHLLLDINNVGKILDLYKREKFNDIGLFRIAQKYYEIIFLAKEFYGFDELKFVFRDYEEKNVDSNRIIDYLTDSGYYSVLINDIIVNKDSLDESEKLSTIKNECKSMNIIFTFWRKIFNSIEVSIDDKKEIIYYIIRPENLYILEYEKKYILDIVDYSSRDSRLMSLYDNIDSYVFEMIANSCYNSFNLAKIFFYYGLELINILLFTIHNIILLILYYKSWKDDYSKYNEIENNKTSNILYILTGIHIFYIIAIITNWFINRLYIDYYYALSKYSRENFAPKYYIMRLRKKFPKLKEKLMGNYSKIFSAIKDFFSDSKDKAHFSSFTEYQYKQVLIVNTILLNPKVYPFLISLICLILHFFVSQIFLVLPLLLLAKLIPTLSAIFTGLFSKFKYLVFVYIYTMLVLYIFSWIAFLYIPKLFKIEVVDKYNENIVDNDQELVEENVCSSSIQCFLYFLNFGLSSGGALDLNLISFKNNYGYYLRQFFFDIFLFLFINMIFSNVFLALITDAFTEMRELAWKKENDKVNICFICDLNQSDCIKENKIFKRHKEDHLKWKYINFMSKLLIDDDVEFNYEEYYIWNLMKTKNINWFPISKYYQSDY